MEYAGLARIAGKASNLDDFEFGRNFRLTVETVKTPSLLGFGGRCQGFSPLKPWSVPYYFAATGLCTCPAGKPLYRNGTNCLHNGHLATKYTGTRRDCLPCEQRAQCLRTPEKTKVRQVAFFRGKAAGEPESHTDRMKQAIDSEAGKARYGRRFATVEPVFGNLRHNKRLDRFTLRGRKKVDTQWKLFCLVHNIEKLAHHGFGQ
jgi:hypothetical protein